jgi:hypothetical protein
MGNTRNVTEEYHGLKPFGGYMHNCEDNKMVLREVGCKDLYTPLLLHLFQLLLYTVLIHFQSFLHLNTGFHYFILKQWFTKCGPLNACGCGDPP